MLSSLEPGFSFGQLAFYAAEVHGANTQVRSDVMLRHPLNNMRAFFNKVLVTLFGRIANKRSKLIHIMNLPFGGHLKYCLNEPGLFAQFIDHLHSIFFMHKVNDRGFNGFNREWAGHVVNKTIERGQAFLLKKELNGLIASILIYKGPQATLFNKHIMLRSFSFLQQ